MLNYLKNYKKIESVGIRFFCDTYIFSYLAATAASAWATAAMATALT